MGIFLTVLSAALTRTRHRQSGSPSLQSQVFGFSYAATSHHVTCLNFSGRESLNEAPPCQAPLSPRGLKSFCNLDILFFPPSSYRSTESSTSEKLQCVSSSTPSSADSVLTASSFTSTSNTSRTLSLTSTNNTLKMGYVAAAAPARHHFHHW